MEERLRKFAAVVEHGSFTKAAGHLRISQPALSTAIRQLERQLGGPLLKRQTRPLQMTAAGQAAYDAGRSIGRTAENLQHVLADMRGSRQALTIGMTDSIAQGLLANDHVLSALEDQADVSLVVDNSRMLRQAVLAGTVDTAFVVAGETLAPKGLRTAPVGNEELLLVCRPDMQVACQRDSKAGYLPRFIAYDRQSATHRLVMQGLREHGIAVKTTFYSTSPDVIARLVLLGRGVAALPSLQVGPLVGAGTLAVPGGLSVMRPIVHIRADDKWLPPVVGRLEQYVRHLLVTPGSVAQHGSS